MTISHIKHDKNNMHPGHHYDFSGFNLITVIGGGDKDPALVAQTAMPLTDLAHNVALSHGWVMSHHGPYRTQYYRPSAEPRGSVMLFVMKAAVEAAKKYEEAVNGSARADQAGNSVEGSQVGGSRVCCPDR
jgi:hypothetical protein